MNNTEQRSIEWFRARLGKITGSRVYDLLGKPKSKDSEWTQTAIKYICRLQYERSIDKDVYDDDYRFANWLDVNDITNKAMRLGTENEPVARGLFMVEKGLNVEEVGSVMHPDIPRFAASPDGIFYDCEKKGIIEIKCPSPDTYQFYRNEIKDNGTLLKNKPEYYYQMQAEMMCTGSDYGYFIAYSEFHCKPIHIVRIDADTEAMQKISDAVARANDYIKMKMDEDAVEELDDRKSVETDTGCDEVVEITVHDEEEPSLFYDNAEVHAVVTEPLIGDRIEDDVSDEIEFCKTDLKKLISLLDYGSAFILDHKDGLTSEEKARQMRLMKKKLESKLNKLLKDIQ